MRVGKYLLDHPLGKGGMGEVWKARDESLGRTVALKLLAHRDPEDLARFRREAELAARLAHPNIAAIYEAGEDYIAMQLVEGVPLDRAKLPIRESVRAIRDAASALHEAHKNGIVHRDLKPANLMIDASGHVTVLDFGLAKSVRSPSDLSMSGMILGTPSFMAPEQAEGNPVDRRTDVYGLGATLYALVTGRAPFVGDDAMRILQSVIGGEPPPARKIAPYVPREVEVILQKSMQRDSSQRYASAKALEEDLTRWLEGEPITARPASLAYRLWKRVRKQPAAWALGTLAAVAVLAGSGAAVAGAVTEGRLQRERYAALMGEKEATPPRRGGSARAGRRTGRRRGPRGGGGAARPRHGPRRAAPETAVHREQSGDRVRRTSRRHEDLLLARTGERAPLER